jgi:CubicO group peptidase (beta-lactamase class C family)
VTLFSIDQDGQPITGRFAIHDGRLRMKFPSIHAQFEARTQGTDQIAGTWKQVYRTPLVLRRGEPPLQVEPPPAEELTAPALEQVRRECDAPALAAAVAHRGYSARVWVAGSRGAGKTAPVEAADVWHLGSISKSFTATLAARLIEQEAMGWDTTVGSVLGELVPEMQAAYRGVTLRHLLSNRAGMPTDIAVSQLLTFLLDDAREVRAQRRRFSRIVLQMKPTSSPGERYQYSNCGYVVAGAMMEALTGRSWEELMKLHVFSPLGLRSAGFGAPDAGMAGQLQQPVGHSTDVNARLLKLFGGRGLRALRPGSATQTDNPRVLGPAATVHMNLEDLLVYLAAHRDSDPLLRPESWRTLHTPPFGGDYAMGWIRRSDGSYWHNGSNTFWYAEAQWHPETGVAAAAVCNEARPAAMNAVGDVLRRVVAG